MYVLVNCFSWGLFMLIGILLLLLDCVIVVLLLCVFFVDFILVWGFVFFCLGFVFLMNVLLRDDDLFFFYVLFFLKGIDEFF